MSFCSVVQCSYCSWKYLSIPTCMTRCGVIVVAIAVFSPLELSSVRCWGEDKLKNRQLSGWSCLSVLLLLFSVTCLLWLLCQAVLAHYQLFSHSSSCLSQCILHALHTVEEDIRWGRTERVGQHSRTDCLHRSHRNRRMSPSEVLIHTCKRHWHTNNNLHWIKIQSESNSKHHWCLLAASADRC